MTSMMETKIAFVLLMMWSWRILVRSWYPTFCECNKILNFGIFLITVNRLEENLAYERRLFYSAIIPEVNADHL